MAVCGSAFTPREADTRVIERSQQEERLVFETSDGRKKQTASGFLKNPERFCFDQRLQIEI